MILNNESNTPASFNNNTSNEQTSNLIRLVEDANVIKRIQFDEMSVDILPKDAASVTPSKDKEFGITCPIIRINDVMVLRKNIKSMSLNSSGFFPTITLSLMFNDSAFISKNAIKDGDLVSLYLRASTNALQYLRNEFIITSCYSNVRMSGETTVTISGKLFVPGFDSTKNSKSYVGTSKNVLRDIAADYGLGFAFNDYDDTNDFQSWIQCRESADVFINEITSHAWKNETSFFDSWIDLYYNLCYVNVNKFLLSNENEEDIDITFATQTYNLYSAIDPEAEPDKVNAMPKVLSTSGMFRTTPFFIKKWQPINNGTSVSLNNGYETTTYTFLHNQNLFGNKNENYFSVLKNRPAIDETKADTFILQRGRTRYDPDNNPKGEMARVNYDFIGTYEKAEYIGIDYVLNDDDKNKDIKNWSGNVHKNYSRAVYHNSQNFAELNKTYLRVECEGLNLQIMRGERVPVVITFTNEMQKEFYNNATNDPVQRDSDRYYSGYYIVDSIEYEYKISSETPSQYKTIFTLKRREWPTPETIVKETNE